MSDPISSILLWQLVLVLNLVVIALQCYKSLLNVNGIEAFEEIDNAVKEIDNNELTYLAKDRIAGRPYQRGDLLLCSNAR